MAAWTDPSVWIFVRGFAKMRLKCTLSLSVMLTMALGRIKEKRGEHLRSLVRAA